MQFLINVIESYVPHRNILCQQCGQEGKILKITKQLCNCKCVERFI